MEQASLAYYLAENNYPNLAIPIRNKQGDWFLEYQGKRYMVLQLHEQQRVNHSSPGRQLAEFHQLGSMYRYEPKEISSYGQWKHLWIEKLSLFEKNMTQTAMENPCPYHRLVMDVFPYIIGISENAIQYVQETEQEYRFDMVDQGTISFKRYHDNITNSVLWADSLVYDHPARDLAEHIRTYFLQEEIRSNEINEFLQDYQSVRPLSIFSWRLLYARLIFPIHLYDILERGMMQRTSYDQLYHELKPLLANQQQYEQRLAHFFANLDIDQERLQIPVLHWL